MEHAPGDFLCESCGYDIGGIPAEHNCPECGRPIASSHPVNRPGSPWQIRPSIRSWVGTNYLILRHPARILDHLRVDFHRMLSLLFTNLLLAALMLTAPWVGTLIGDPARNSRSASGLVHTLITIRSSAIGTTAIFVSLYFLTFIEAMGVRFFGTRRGWRITPSIAWQICAHASVGWIIAAVLTLLSLIVWLNLSHFGLSGLFSAAGRTGNYLLASVPLAGFFVGMLVFEVLVYAGMRRCRFANAPQPPAPIRL